MNYLKVRLRRVGYVNTMTSDLVPGGSWHWTSYFRLSDMAMGIEYAKLFDQYRIVRASAQWIPSWTKPSYNEAVALQNDPKAAALSTTKVIRPVEPPMVVYGIDRDLGDHPTVGKWEDLINRPGFRLTQFNHPISQSIAYPTILTAVDEGTGGTATWNAQRKAPWLDTDEPGIKHYGFRWAMLQPRDYHTNPTETTALTWTCVITYWLQFRRRITSVLTGTSNTNIHGADQMDDDTGPASGDEPWDGRDDAGPVAVAGT